MPGCQFLNWGLFMIRENGSNIMLGISVATEGYWVWCVRCYFKVNVCERERDRKTERCVDFKRLTITSNIVKYPGRTAQ
jgi:hypothetical protein